MLFTEIKDTGGGAILLSELMELLRNSSCLDGKGHVHYHSGSHELRHSSPFIEVVEPILLTMGEVEKDDPKLGLNNIYKLCL